jgi:hypothetical protein
MTSTCCGLASGYLPGSRFTSITFNDARNSEVGIVVEGTGGTHTERLVLRKNRGSLVPEGQPQALGAFRVIAPVRAQPQL